MINQRLAILDARNPAIALNQLWEVVLDDPMAAYLGNLPQYTGAAFRISQRACHFLKIDVEGYEKFVLEGAPSTLDRVSCVYLESWEGHFSRYRYACRDVTNLLAKKGFTVLKLMENQSVVPVSTDYSSRTLENLIAVRELEDFLERTRFGLTK